MRCRKGVLRKSLGEPDIYVDKRLCVGCGICERVCPENAVRIKGGKAEINENCRGCLICLEECPFNAIKRR